MSESLMISWLKMTPDIFQGENEGSKWDVIVSGAGPGGCLAAKKCAAHGFRTLLVERKKLPRDKVCSGMVAGPWAQSTIREEFGEIPETVLVNPYSLQGQMFHVPGAEPRWFPWHTPIAWRRELDGWMAEKAQEEGVEIWDKCTLVRMGRDGEGYGVGLVKEGRTIHLSARYVIGADGAGSLVRKSIFPGLNVRYSLPVRECHKGVLNLDVRFFHWFFPKNAPRPRFDINFKGDIFLIEGSGMRELGQEIGTVLSSHGGDPSRSPLWRDTCRIALLHDDLASGAFRPARNNVLLVGDAAGLILPISFEGIGSALKSGLLAADSVQEASRQGRDSASIYLDKLRPLLEEVRRLHVLNRGLTSGGHSSPDHLSDALIRAYRETLTGQV